ncbi:glucosamine 6-phosphate N-acetyltransferase-like [Lineus longissimus]|uniref:glucosamine 6-phosphate N-acetyltransferase-like n=1 Tax=Lineus longissimus TaxID=88925 RepID=UPI002B4E3516
MEIQNGITDEVLFSPDLLEEIDFEAECNATFNPKISPSCPGESLLMRPLRISDYDKGHTQVLSQLTKLGDVTREAYEAQFHHMKSCPSTYYIAVIEDITSNLVIASATLLVEKKFIHTCCTRGRIEDVVVDKTYRGRQLGKLLVETMTLLGKHLGVYKMTLECKDDRMKFYESFGYMKDHLNNFMTIRYKD